MLVNAWNSNFTSTSGRPWPACKTCTPVRNHSRAYITQQFLSSSKCRGERTLTCAATVSRGTWRSTFLPDYYVWKISITCSSAHQCLPFFADREVYRGVYGEWEVEESDVKEVLGYRAGISVAAAGASGWLIAKLSLRFKNSKCLSV